MTYLKSKLLIFFIIFILIISAIIYLYHFGSRTIEEDQFKITKELVYSLNTALIETKKQVKLFSKIIQAEFDLHDTCNLPFEDNILSSIYYPKSAIHGHRTNCFVKTSK